MRYSIGDYKFNVEEFFPYELYSKITEVRVDFPDVVYQEAQARKRRETLTRDGKLTILACDHPARNVTKSGDDPIAMANRRSYLGRVLRVITSEEFDGVMGPPDIIEELLIVNYLVKEAGGEGFLDEKVILGCMNRGGLSGTIFEMDDRFTAYTAEMIAEMRLDGAKMMFRLDSNSSDSGKTIMYCAQAINECLEYGIYPFVEALWVEKTEDGYKAVKRAEELAKVVGVASALGVSSAYTWLKIPYCDNFEIVAGATTLPILMLGGASRGDPTPVLEEFVNGMKAGPNVRGALVGRNVHHPGDDDPLAVALAINGIVHKGYDLDQAVECLMESRGKEMDRLSKYL
jgi:DhnA family fructose-bisphosphate aldolase class Ia